MDPSLSRAVKLLNILEQFQSSVRAVLVGSLEYGNFCFVSARLSLKRHYPLSYFYQSSFRAVSEQFQSSLRAAWYQFQCSFRAVSEQFQSSFRAVLVGSLEYGNFCLASARLSLKRHYPLSYFFQIIFFIRQLTNCFWRANRPLFAAFDTGSHHWNNSYLIEL